MTLAADGGRLAQKGMRDRLSLRTLGLALMTLLALAFASGSYARAAPTLADVKLDAYILSGGSALDLCRQADGDHAHLAECALCHLVAASNLPEAGLSLIRIDARMMATVILPQIRRAAARPRDPATPPRGPPILT